MLGTSAHAATPATTYREGDDEAAILFDPLRMSRVALTLSDEAYNALQQPCAEWGGKADYQEGTVTLSVGRRVIGPLTVGIRLKGGWGSYRCLNGKAGFKVKINWDAEKKQRLLGLKKLTLNNMVQDPSMFHEALAYRLFRAMDVAAPRVGYARVTLNGQDYGLYTNIETPDDVMLDRWFDSTQHLYEGAYWQDVEPGRENEFEMDEGKEDGRGDLIALMAAANAPADRWWERMNEVADMPQMVREWATEIYIGHWDGYAHEIKNNYYLHSDDGDRFSLLPWGTDQTFDAELSWDQSEGRAVMFRGCMASDPCFQLYRQALRDVRTTALALDLPMMAGDVWVAIASAALADPRKEYGTDWMAWSHQRTRDFLAIRPVQALDYLASSLPGIPVLTVERRGAAVRLSWTDTPGWRYPTQHVEIETSADGSAWSVLDESTSTSHTFRPVKNTPMWVRVRAVNSLGASEWTPGIQVVRAPGSPGTVTARRLPASLAVSWTAPATGWSGTFAGYRVVVLDVRNRVVGEATVPSLTARFPRAIAQKAFAVRVTHLTSDFPGGGRQARATVL